MTTRIAKKKKNRTYLRIAMKRSRLAKSRTNLHKNAMYFEQFLSCHLIIWLKYKEYFFLWWTTPTSSPVALYNILSINREWKRKEEGKCNFTITHVTTFKKHTNLIPFVRQRPSLLYFAQDMKFLFIIGSLNIFFFIKHACVCLEIISTHVSTSLTRKSSLPIRCQVAFK